MHSHLMTLGLLAAVMATGCARNAPPAHYTYNTHQVNNIAPSAPLPPPAPCGHSLTVKVGKLDVDMPKGGTLDIAGVKGSTNAYHVVLEGVEFTNTETQTCFTR